MNALANSQLGELEKFLQYGYPQGRAPVTFQRYTGQESLEQRNAILACPPDILLTNYVMLELLLTRPDERGLINSARELRFLVLDELHTYRGRQGADVAMLIRRTREACEVPRPIHVGTSATLAGGDSWSAQQLNVVNICCAPTSRRSGSPRPGWTWAPPSRMCSIWSARAPRSPSARRSRRRCPTRGPGSGQPTGPSRPWVRRSTSCRWAKAGSIAGSTWCSAACPEPSRRPAPAVAVFIDGPHHDAPDQQVEHEAVRDRLEDAGYLVVRFHHAADWAGLLARYPNVIGEPTPSPTLPGPPERREQFPLAVLSAVFVKPDEVFTEDEILACRRELPEAAIRVLSEISRNYQAEIAADVTRCEQGSLNIELALAVAGLALSAIGAFPIVLNVAGLLLQAAASDLRLLSDHMSVSGAWLQRVGYNLLPSRTVTPDSRSLPLGEPRPICFGKRGELDKRTSRCRRCEFLSGCEQIARSIGATA